MRPSFKVRGRGIWVDASIALFLGGDVMTGRGIDQILPHPSSPVLYEPYVTSAQTYVELAEAVHGPIPRPVDPSYIWGDALAEARRHSPDVCIVNLETAVTRSTEPWLEKEIHYRMHPDNVDCLSVAKIDCCVLANNHVLDWGRRGLEETLKTLHKVHIDTAGCGWDYRIPTAQIDFTRALIDHAGIDLVHGHSSHHPKGIEVLLGAERGALVASQSQRPAAHHRHAGGRRHDPSSATTHSSGCSPAFSRKTRPRLEIPSGLGK